MALQQRARLKPSETYSICSLNRAGRICNHLDYKRDNLSRCLEGNGHLVDTHARRPIFIERDPMPLDPSILISMFGTDVIVEVSEPSLFTRSLFPDELEHIALATDKRKAEFGTGRICARRALGRLGVAHGSLIPNPDGSPRWPKGIIGSITHTSGCCAVAISNAPRLLSIGLDIEQDTPLPSKLESMVCTKRESAWLEQYDETERAHWRKHFFSAKEAFYKCQYATTLAALDFHDVDLAFDIVRQSFSVVALGRRGPDWDIAGRAKGQFRRVAGLVISTVSLEALNEQS